MPDPRIPERPGRTQDRSRPARILIVEDDDDVRELLVEMLRKARYEVAQAADGRHGLAAADVDPPDLIITDVHMPEVDGLQLIRVLRQRWPAVPIIAVSGGSARGLESPLALQTATRLGANRTLRKPLDLQGLIETIRELLGAANG